METRMAPAADRMIAYWPLLAFAGFAWKLTPPVHFVGYNWLYELAIAVFLLVSCALLALGKPSGAVRRISRTELIWIVSPMVLFTLWSGLSSFWASSWRNALHHTLLWACFTVFYLLVRLVVDDERWRATSLNVIRYLVCVLGAACMIEFLLSTKEAKGDFLVRYYVYAEIFVTLLPIILVLVIDKSVSSMRWMFISLVVWCSVVVVASRTVFAAGVGAVLVLTALLIVVQRNLVNVRRLFAFLGIAAAVTLGSQVLLKSDAERALFQRFAGTDMTNVQSAQVRLFYWDMALEGFKISPIVGLGGDNYFTRYKDLRERYVSTNRENPVIELGEGSVPERVHNEYLQILCELGAVGGVLFGWLLAGLAYMGILAIRKRASLLTCGALVGLAAFLASSFATSYSFRIPLNGLCFFFLIAIAARELFSHRRTDNTERAVPKRAILFAGFVISVAMLIFSGVRAASFISLSHFQYAQSKARGLTEIKTAIALDPSEPMFRFANGQALFYAGRNDPKNYDEAIPNFRIAIDRGMPTSLCYFSLIGAETMALRLDEAEATFQEALSLYPRSVFLLTAHARFLKVRGDLASANVEGSKALEINPLQARSWQLAHDEGLQTLAMKAKADASFVPPGLLIPENGAAILNEYQQQLMQVNR